MIALLLIAIFVTAPWLTVLIGVFTAINAFISIVTFELSIEDILSLILNSKISRAIDKIIKNKKVSKAASEVVGKILDDIIKK